MHPTDYTFRLYDKNQNFCTLIASKIMAPYQFWLDNGVKTVSLQFNFQRQSIYDLKTDESDSSFLSLSRYGPFKQNFCLIPYNDTSRPPITPQEYLIHFDDFLLPCNIPTQIVKPLTVIKHIVSSPLDDKDKSYYTALAKQSHSYNELLFISAKICS